MPSTFTTGYRYAGLGYTTAFDAAVAPLMARHSHAELDDTPCVDGGIFVLMGNDEYLLRQIDAGERDRARDYAAWLLGATGAYAVKIVNPGGIEAGRRASATSTGLDDAVAGRQGDPARHPGDAGRRGQRARGCRTRCTSTATTWASPGNAATTLASMETLAGRRAHFTHLQFHSYGGERGKSWASAARDRSSSTSTPIPR